MAVWLNRLAAIWPVSVKVPTACAQTFPVPRINSDSSTATVWLTRPTPGQADRPEDSSSCLLADVESRCQNAAGLDNENELVRCTTEAAGVACMNAHIIGSRWRTGRERGGRRPSLIIGIGGLTRCRPSAHHITRGPARRTRPCRLHHRSRWRNCQIRRRVGRSDAPRHASDPHVVDAVGFVREDPRKGKGSPPILRALGDNRRCTASLWNVDGKRQTCRDHKVCTVSTGAAPALPLWIRPGCSTNAVPCVCTTSPPQPSSTVSVPVFTMV